MSDAEPQWEIPPENRNTQWDDLRIEHEAEREYLAENAAGAERDCAMRVALSAAAPYLMPDQEALAMALQEHHPTTGMAVTSGVTCQCGYWNGNERPGVDRPAGTQGRDGLDWHRAQVVLALLNGSEVKS